MVQPKIWDGGEGVLFAQYGIKTREVPGKNTGQTMQSLKLHSTTHSYVNCTYLR